MRRLFGVTIAAALAAAAVTAWGLAAPDAGGKAAWKLAAPAAAVKDAGITAPEVRRRRARRLPPLPAEVRRRREWNIGVKCDAPPFGYINVRGENAGFDVEIARWFSRFAFGRANRVNFICAPTPTREPLLTTGRADLVIATFTYTRDRDTRIDFSRAYYQATGRLLVRNNSPIRSIRDLRGRTVATTSGSIYDRWVRRCFQNTRLIVTDSLTNAQIAFRDGRADTLMWDDTVLVGIATSDPQLKLTNDTFLPGPYGIGIRQGNVAMKRWVDSRLNLMRQRNIFTRILRNNVPRRLYRGFLRNILRPRNTFGYGPANQPSPETVCPS
jgi:polar amino acid transport system substrate-binding protein